MFQSRLYKIPKADAKKRMETLIADFSLGQFRKYPVSSYSGGIKRRLDIALSMMSHPKLLFLDEPTVGMDIRSRMSMWEMMKKISDDFGTTIFLTTHYLEEADHLSDTVCIMKDGKDVIQGSLHKLRALIHQDNLQIQFAAKAAAKECEALLSGQYGMSGIGERNDALVIHTTDSHFDLERVMTILLERHIPFQGVEIVKPSLEDVFLRLTNKTGQEEIR